MISLNHKRLFLLFSLVASYGVISAQVGIGTTNPRGTLEIHEPSETTEAAILVLSDSEDRKLSILQPNILDPEDPFTIATENSIQFRIDSNDVFSIDPQGDIGINTSDALADFHIAGASSTVRFDFLNSTNNMLNNGIDPSLVMVDSNGELFLKENLDDFPINDTDQGTFFNTPITIQDPSGTLVATNAYSKTITLTKKTLIQIAFYTSVTISNYAGGPALDQKPRIYGSIVTHQQSGTDIIYNSSSHTNALIDVLNSGQINSGFYTVGGTGFITLDPGTHTFELDIFAGGGTPIITPLTIAEGYRITFGNNGLSRFQIIYHN